ncbi:MAG TPA: phosphate signaling complex protein PhoU [Candidatus Deferrimicrobiaceae bacterium]|nr:phosphate signaling complex protein PhoU [Candidatus Deferrimicrobiaceae bacterium]
MIERPFDAAAPGEPEPGDRSGPSIGPRGVLEREEREVKDEVLRMGSRVERQIRTATQAFLARDRESADAIRAADAEINEMQREVGERITIAIATQAPVARDLRLLLALNHVASELERIGDHAVGIARQVRWLSPDDVPLPAAEEISRMGALAGELVTGILRALVETDVEAAREVAARDDEIDHGYARVFEAAVHEMRTNPEAVERGTRTVLVAHWLERIGDRVTNIAEDVVHLETGQVEDLNR